MDILMLEHAGPLASSLLSLAVLGALALFWGGAVILRRGDRQKGLLMLGCGVVVLGNVLIWAL
jgi:hypothetical protein